MPRNILSIKQKALSINLDKRKYGAFAEIGAGQEVVRHFFQAGGASGTVAKSMSAYDMVFSDVIYGKKETSRYVSQPRLLSMLQHEYDLIIERLLEKRSPDSTFFTFADTIATRNLKTKTEGHGWLGVRFQRQAHAEPCTVVMHVRLLDHHHLMQQEVIGVIGVNLIYAVFHYCDDVNLFIESLLDNIAPDRIEIDMIEFNGSDLQHIDNRLANLHLVKTNSSKAVLFSADGSIKQPTDFLYKKAVLIQRGSFRPVTLVNEDMQKCAHKRFLNEPQLGNKEPVILMEITLSNLYETGNMVEQDFLDRIDLLTTLGHSVLVSNYAKDYEFAAYIAHYTKSIFAFVIGISHLKELFNEAYYQDLDGGILEAFGKLFACGSKLYIYPEYDATHDTLFTAANFTVPKHLNFLYQYLLSNQHIVDLDNCDISKMNIYSRDVLQLIKDNKPEWKQYVPAAVAKTIKEKKLWTKERV